MIGTFIIIIILGLAAYRGRRVGLITALARLIAVMLAVISARTLHSKLVPFLTLVVPYPKIQRGQMSPYLLHPFKEGQLLQIDLIFYRVLAYLLVFIASYIVLRWLLQKVEHFRIDQVPQKLDAWGGALVRFLTMTIFVFYGLTFLAFMPFKSIQRPLAKSHLAQATLLRLPYFSTYNEELLFKQSSRDAELGVKGQLPDVQWPEESSESTE